MRLNYRIRNLIANNVVADAYDEAVRDLDRRRFDFSNQVYRSFISEEHEAMLRADSTNIRTSLYIVLTDDAGNDLYTSNLAFSPDNPKPYSVPSITPVRNTAFRDQARALDQEMYSLNRNRNVLHGKIMELTKLTTTLNSLKKMWPEGIKYIPEDAPAEDTETARKEMVAEVNGLLLDAGVELEE